MTNNSKPSVFDVSPVSDVISDMQNVDRCIAVYKAALGQGDIQQAYGYLLRYVMHLKAHCTSTLGNRFLFGNVSPGYMDFTYFPFYDDYLRARKLRFGIVLNHQALRFELWLMGQNAAVQKTYWSMFKNSTWNEGRTDMPRYSVLESVLIVSPNFKDTDLLTSQIQEEALRVSEAVLDGLRAFEAKDKPC